MIEEKGYRFSPAPGDTLSASERAQLRARLVRHMAHNPFSESPIPAAGYSAWRSGWMWNIYLGRSVAFAALVLVLGGGVSYAAEGAVPGDLLYVLNRSVTEPVQGMLAVGADKKVSWSAELASRRLAEAEALAAEGRLDEATAATLESDFRATAARVDEHLAALEAEAPDEAAVVAVKVAASLSAHGSILATIDGQAATGVRASADEWRSKLARADEGDDDSDVAPVLAMKTAPNTFAVSATIEAPPSTSTSAEVASSSEAAPQPRAKDSGSRARAFKDAALAVRAAAGKALEHSEASLSSEALAEASASLAQIDADIAEEDYQSALRQAQSLIVLINAAASLKFRSEDGSRSDRDDDDGEEESAREGSDSAQVMNGPRIQLSLPLLQR